MTAIHLSLVRLEWYLHKCCSKQRKTSAYTARFFARRCCAMWFAVSTRHGFILLKNQPSVLFALSVYLLFAPCRTGVNILFSAPKALTDSSDFMRSKEGQCCCLASRWCLGFLLFILERKAFLSHLCKFRSAFLADRLA